MSREKIKISDIIFSDFYNALRYIEQKKESLELARLFYVAVTRAKISCIFTATVGYKTGYKTDCKPDSNDNNNFDLAEIKISSNSILSNFLFLLDNSEYKLIDNYIDLQKLFDQPFNLPNNKNLSVNNGNIFNKIKYIDGNEYNINNILISNTSSDGFNYLRSKTRDLFIKPVENNNPGLYLLSDDSMRIIGIFVHKLLYNIINKYLAVNNILINGEICSDLIKNWRNCLLNAGIGLNNINKAIEIVSLAVKNILIDKVGKWILADYDTSLAEQEFYYYKKSKLKKAIIDRLFIDNNIIWMQINPDEMMPDLIEKNEGENESKFMKK
jgi:hypothetical protein